MAPPHNGFGSSLTELTKKMSVSAAAEITEKLRVLNEEIAVLEQQARDIASGRLDAEIPRLYAALLQSAENNEEEEAAAAKVKEEEEPQAPVVAAPPKPQPQKRSRKSHARRELPPPQPQPPPPPQPKAEEPAPKTEEEKKREVDALQKKMDEVVRLALRKDTDKFFHAAVTDDDAAGYTESVLHRSHLGLLRRRVARGRYAWPVCRSAAEAGALFSRDLMLMYANALMFNKTDSDIHETTVMLKVSPLSFRFHFWSC